jgi:plasmid stabilization system protein ParE
MTVEFTNRAVADLRKISAHSREEFGARVTAALEGRIREVIENIAKRPESAQD